MVVFQVDGCLWCPAVRQALKWVLGVQGGCGEEMRVVFRDDVSLMILSQQLSKSFPKLLDSLRLALAPGRAC